MFHKTFLFFFLYSLFSFAQTQDKLTGTNADSLYHYRAYSENDQFAIDERIKYVKKAIQFSIATKQDSAVLKTKRYLVTLYLRKYVSDSDSLRKFTEDSIYKLNHQNLKLANKVKDTLALAYINNVLAWSHTLKNQIDSSYYYYYNASKHFNTLSMIQDEAITLFRMANIQFEERDYVGCEQNAVEAIKLFQKLPKTETILDYLWSTHNLVAIASDELELFDKSIEYHYKALTYSDQINDNYLYTLYSNSNIALIYIEQKQYSKALSIYENLLKSKEVLLQEPKNYALILGDFAILKHKMGSYPASEIKKMFYEAYKLGDSLQDHISIMSISLNASEFYLSNKSRDSAMFFANRAYNLGLENNANDVVLKSLLLKSKMEDSINAFNYLNDYIKLSNSLVTKERSIRNKFARIEFETDQIEQENLRISRERMWLMILSAGLLVTLILLYIIISQRAKNKELKLVQQQQEANEEIYNLMLSQQDKIDEARTTEKRRISEELHDGVLGKLFGIRLSLDSLNLSVKEDAIQTRSNYIDELKNVEQEIRKVSHELNTDFVSGAGFLDIIKTLVETQTKAYQLQYSIEHNDDINWDNVPNKTKIHIYRIIQESLQNIYKHANATHVKISFTQKNNVICLTINDNGSGFDVNKAKKGIGLKNMTSRVHEIQGVFDVISERDQGTTITIKVPI